MFFLIVFFLLGVSIDASRENEPTVAVTPLLGLLGGACYWFYQISMVPGLAVLGAEGRWLNVLAIVANIIGVYSMVKWHNHPRMSVIAVFLLLPAIIVGVHSTLGVLALMQLIMNLL